MRKAILVVLVAMILAGSGSLWAAQPAKGANEAEHQRIEQRVDSLDREMGRASEATDKRIDDQRAYAKDLVEENKRYTERIFFIYTSIIALLITVLSFIGWKGLKGIGQEQVKRQLTDEFIRKIIEEKGGPAVEKHVDELKKKIDEIIATHNSKLEELLKNIEDSGNEKINKVLETIMKNKLQSTLARSVEKNRDIETKGKEIQTNESIYHNWVVRGLAAYKKKQYAEAAVAFVKASEIDQTAEILGAAADSFDECKNYDKAEEYYSKAIVANPNNANNLGNYAVLLHQIRQDYDKAEEYYNKAIAANPKNANNLGNYAIFLKNIRKNYNEAERYYNEALKINPNDADFLGNYAVLLHEIRQDYNKAEEYYNMAINANPRNPKHINNYAVFLHKIRNNHKKAEEYYRKAAELDPTDTNVAGNYTGFLLSREQYE